MYSSPQILLYHLCALQVPRLGVGTIAWSADTPEDKERIAGVANAALSKGLTMFDTAERHGAKQGPACREPNTHHGGLVSSSCTRGE